MPQTDFIWSQSYACVCVNEYLFVKVSLWIIITVIRTVFLRVTDLAPQGRLSFSSGSVRSYSASMLWTRNVKFGRNGAWDQGNALYTSCETPLKSKEATSLGKTQSELTALTGSRLSIAYSQKHEGAECRSSPRDGLGMFPCRPLTLFTAPAGWRLRYFLHCSNCVNGHGAFFFFKVSIAL